MIPVFPNHCAHDSKNLDLVVMENDSMRIWSPDQKITKKKDGNIVLTFTASSERELISWVLSFGDQAKLVQPKRSNYTPKGSKKKIYYRTAKKITS